MLFTLPGVRGATVTAKDFCREISGFLSLRLNGVPSRTTRRLELALRAATLFFQLFVFTHKNKGPQGGEPLRRGNRGEGSYPSNHTSRKLALQWRLFPATKATNNVLRLRTI
jgi:hypothetical protein